MTREVYGVSPEELTRLKEGLESARFSDRYFIERVSPRGGIEPEPAYHVENASVQLSPFDSLGRHKPRMIIIAKEDEHVRQAKSALEIIGSFLDNELKPIRD